MIRSLLLMMLLTGATASFGQSEKYNDAMTNYLQQLSDAKTTQDYQKLSAAFERVATAEKTLWLPYYYAAYSLAMAGWTDANLDKDANAKKGKALVAAALALSDNAELYALTYMFATQQMLVDPPSRYMTFGQEAAAALEKGLKMQPDNPRLNYLKGMALVNTPEAFGGGKQKGKLVLEAAVKFYEAEEVKPLHPSWGKQQAVEALNKIE